MKVSIYRASQDVLSGRIDYIGVADLPIEYVELGTRVIYSSGNGTPSGWISYSSSTVEGVRIGGWVYLPTISTNGTKRVIIHYDNAQQFSNSKIIQLIEE
jgi:hypothetical protein